VARWLRRIPLNGDALTCNHNDTAALVFGQGGSAAGPKPGRDGFSGKLRRHPPDSYSVTTTLPRRTGCSTISCAVAISASGNRAAISKPLQPFRNASFIAFAAATLTS
jgi:hypothetical protein